MSARRTLLALLLLGCMAHVGSPDAWYEGPAGPYTVLVHLQAPPVVPGIAIVNVRATGISWVTAFVNTYDATGGTPPPDTLRPVAGDSAWRSTRLWVMSAGSNSVTIAVRGERGDGTVVVPLVAVAGRRLEFNPWLAGPLVAVAAFLFIGLFTIVGATVREGVLPPGAEPDVDRMRRARRATVRAVFIVGLVIVGMGAWWRADDRAFARNLFRPLPIAARIDSGTPLHLTFTITDSAWLHRNDSAWAGPRGGASLSGGLVEDHGKLVHLFLIAADGHSAFAHLHPTTRDSVSFTAQLPGLPAGSYSLFADIVHASGFTQTMATTVTLPAPPMAASDAGTPDSDDSWIVAGPAAERSRATLEDGTTLTLARDATPIVAGEEAGLRFAIAPPPGEPLALEPYLGMAGHAAVVRDDAKVFIHLHPLGTISLAAQARLSGGASGTAHVMPAETMPADTLYFPYAFPDSGSYTVWVQLKRRSRILTGAFAVDVAPAPQR